MVRFRIQNLAGYTLFLLQHLALESLGVVVACSNISLAICQGSLSSAQGMLLVSGQPWMKIFLRKVAH